MLFVEVSVMFENSFKSHNKIEKQTQPFLNITPLRDLHGRLLKFKIL